MVKEDYKETIVGAIPEEWDFKPLKEVCKFKNGKSTDYYSNLEEGKYHIYGSNGPIGSLNESNFENGYIVGRVGAVGEIHHIDTPVWVSDNAIQVSIKKNKKIDGSYLFYWLKRRNLGQFSTKSAQPLLNQSTIKTIPIPFPPLPEQEKIASILSSVDKSIEKTSEVIEETKELKKGLMQQLLTKGIGHSEFKDSQFGKIPRSWEVNVMSYAAEINPRYKIPEKEEYLFLEMDSVNEHSPEVDGYEKREKSRCTNVKFKEGDVLFARITPSTENGKTALIEKLEEEIAFGSTELIVLSPKKDLITSEYVYYLLKWSKVRNLAISMMEGSTGRQRVPREVFDDAIKIPLPPIEEQNKISSILSSVDAKIKKEKEYKAKLERLKKGLMQKLLTGEIRVNTDMEV